MAVNRPGFGYVAFAVADVAAAREMAPAAVGGSIGEVVTVAVTGGRVTSCYVTDPKATRSSCSRGRRAPRNRTRSGESIEAFCAFIGTSASFAGYAAAFSARSPRVVCYVVEPVGAAVLVG